MDWKPGIVVVVDVNAKKDWKWDFKALTHGTGDSDYLTAGDTVSTYTLTPDANITVSSSSKTDTDTSVVAWLQFGPGLGEARVNLHLVTTQQREDDFPVTFSIEQS